MGLTKEVLPPRRRAPEPCLACSIRPAEPPGRAHLRTAISVVAIYVVVANIVVRLLEVWWT